MSTSSSCLISARWRPVVITLTSPSFRLLTTLNLRPSRSVTTEPASNGTHAAAAAGGSARVKLAEAVGGSASRGARFAALEAAFFNSPSVRLGHSCAESAACSSLVVACGRANRSRCTAAMSPSSPDGGRSVAWPAGAGGTASSGCVAVRLVGFNASGSLSPSTRTPWRPLVALSALTTTPLRPLSAGRATSEWSTTGVPTASPSEATPVGLAAMMFVERRIA
mmetsp:Transcript_6360/g.20368  ORF Transcript_6360/g.20368 Transcript_6360/m.20368 type:complete len:223 (+) Transcript_6360:1290-1958(+)